MSRADEATDAPHTAVERALAEIWCDVLELDQVGAGDDFFDVGGESLSATLMMVEVQKKFGLKLPLSVLQSAPTLGALARAIERQTKPSLWSALVPLQPDGSLAPFFCVHGVGGSVIGLQGLARHFGPGQPFYGIQAAGSDGDRKPFSRIEDMAAHYLREVRAVQPGGPYYLGGFSFGGSAALEMAQQFQAQGEEVALLAILDHTPPPTRYGRFTWGPTLPFDFAINAARWTMEDIWRAGPGNRLRALRGKVQKLKRQCWNALRGSSSGSGKTDVEEVFGAQRIPDHFRRLMETHYQALRDYVPRPYPGRVTLFRARTRPLFRLHGHDLGWRRLARGGLDVVPIPGNHESLLQEPNVGVLAASLLACLRRAQHAPPGSATPQRRGPVQASR
jgi:thioesterase domain-containing protein/acyl carrier protein